MSKYAVTPSIIDQERLCNVGDVSGRVMIRCIQPNHLPTFSIQVAIIVLSPTRSATGRVLTGTHAYPLLLFVTW